MKLKTLCGLLACVSSLAISPALAQVQDGDVVMRRPIPNDRYNAGQDNCALTGTCPTPEPSCDPLTQNCSQEPEPEPEPEPEAPGECVLGDPNCTPDDSMTCDGTGDCVTNTRVAAWVAGPWEGSASCGAQSSLTREVSCVTYAIGMFDPVTALPPDCEEWYWNGQPEGEDYGDMSHCQVPEPTPYEAPRILEQTMIMPDDLRLVDMRSATVSTCAAAAINTRPVPTYQGTGGGCVYAWKEDEETVWTLPDYMPGTATCSRYAVGAPTFTCVREGGIPVDASYCTSNPRPGHVGIYRGPSGSQVQGNYAGCVTEWQKYVSQSLGCVGTEQRTIFSHGCVRKYPANDKYPYETSDQLEDSECSTPKPADVTETTGACWLKFGGNPDGNRCTGTEIAALIYDGSPNTYEKQQAEWAFCDNNGASCCEHRGRFNTSGGQGAAETVAFSGSPIPGSGNGNDTYTKSCSHYNGTCLYSPSGANVKKWMSYCGYGPC